VVGAELLAASAEVIAARTTRMALDMANPKGQDLVELSLMGTEKAEAAAASAAALAASAGAIGQRLGQAALDEGSKALDAAEAMMTAGDPAAAAGVQLRYMVGWWGRAAGQALALNAALMKAQAEAVAPIHKTATANARRLRKGT